MAESEAQFSKLGFTKAFFFPALSIFLIPAVTLPFFLYAQSDLDEKMRESVLSDIRNDKSMDVQERVEATQYFKENAFSTLILEEQFAAQLDPTLVYYYASFRWMLRLAVGCIASGIAVLLLGSIGIWLSSFSPQLQYRCLAAGWTGLRVYASLLTVAQGLMLVALSFWVTALLFNVYILKLIFIVAFIAICAAFIVIRAIFARQNLDFSIEGLVLNKDSSPDLWSALGKICEKVGTAAPDQVVAGIDDNFFVTEMPVTVGEKTYQGRTLFISLSLLKHLQEDEANAVLAHEMAHFSGNDTFYTVKTAPLMSRYDQYLHELAQEAITRPVFYFMLCFRGLFEWARGKVSRDREFRADRIAMESTSSQAVVGALLRITAYSHYRGAIEKELFDQEEKIESANISERIEKGFPEFASSFLADSSAAMKKTSHPFDSHPPLAQRLAAVGVELESNDSRELLARCGDGVWHSRINAADELEQEQWAEHEKRFREYHEETLPYRFLPETDEERAIVEKAFPPLEFHGKDGLLLIDCEKINYAKWSQPLPLSEFAGGNLHENSRLQLSYERHGSVDSLWLPLASFGTEQQEVLNAIARYKDRHATAVQYQEYRKNEAAHEASD